MDRRPELFEAAVNADGVANARALLEVVDPAGHWAVEIHQYLDPTHAGRDRVGPATTDVGVSALTPVTAWLKEHGLHGFLAEFAAAASSCGPGEDQLGDEALTRMLEHLHAPGSPWRGWAVWSAGPWWPDDEGHDLTPDKPEGAGEAVQMRWLKPFLIPQATGGAP